MNERGKILPVNEPGKSIASKRVFTRKTKTKSKLKVACDFDFSSF